MKKTMMMFFALELLAGGASFAQTSSAPTSRALQKFEGIYDLVDQDISNNPQSQRTGVCYQQIKVARPQGENCEGCSMDLEVLGMPEGQGLIVVQMSKVNQGHQFRFEENPMFPGITGSYESQADVEGNRLSSMAVARNLLGGVRFSTDFKAILNGDVLDYTVHDTQLTNGFVDTTAACRYRRQN